MYLRTSMLRIVVLIMSRQDILAERWPPIHRESDATPVVGVPSRQMEGLATLRVQVRIRGEQL